MISADGIHWEVVLENRPVCKRAHHTSIVYNESIYVIGGKTFDSYLNDVWKSSDGFEWQLVTADAQFCKRNLHTSVTFNDYMYVIGGNSQNKLLNDVWKSNNGLNWEMISESAAFTPRLNHTSLVFKNKIILIGGYGEFVLKGKKYISDLQDVWATYDGIEWVRFESMTKSTTMQPIVGHAAVVIGDKICVIGGGQNGNILRDVVVSTDGKKWDNLKISS